MAARMSSRVPKRYFGGICLVVSAARNKKVLAKECSVVAFAWISRVSFDIVEVGSTI